MNKISVAIDELGGNVFPKMGWSAPRDASWINNNTLKCSLVGKYKEIASCSFNVDFFLLLNVATILKDLGLQLIVLY